MSRISETEFRALTGCMLSSEELGYLLEAADTDVLSELATHGNPSVPESVLHDAALCFAKAYLADRNRFDGTFDVSTTEYSHKGNTETTIANLREQAISKIQAAARRSVTWVKKANP
jgi:hypothetical protein